MSRYNLIGLAGYMNTTRSLGMCKIDLLQRSKMKIWNEVNRF